jgi:hypothetical protein
MFIYCSRRTDLDSSLRPFSVQKARRVDKQQSKPGQLICLEKAAKISSPEKPFKDRLKKFTF